MSVTAAAAVTAAHTVLAAAKANNNDVTPGVLGFLVVAGIAVALYFLLRSMNKQLKKIPPPPPDPEDGEPGEAKPLSPLQAAAARRRAAADAEQKLASGPGRDRRGGGPDLPDGLG
ncbi:MAG: hypothetical protein JO016_05885 [Actinobacteria bacterium]|nr:hypothetical protein [Actinomycetota bacterium]